MFKFAIPAVAALGLIAVAAHSRANNADGANVVPMSWHLSHEGSMAKLAYGVANSDQLALMRTCAPGQAQAIVYGEVQPASPRLIRPPSPRGRSIRWTAAWPTRAVSPCATRRCAACCSTARWRSKATPVTSN